MAEQPENGKNEQLIIIDCDIENDRRVKDAIRETDIPVHILDIRATAAIGMKERARAFLSLLFILSKAFAIGVRGCRKIGFLIWSHRFTPPFKGFMAMLSWLWKAVCAARVICADDAMRCAGRVYSPDLYCAITALMMKPSGYWIYDSHEFQIDRARKKGIARILAEYGLEHMVIAATDEIRVINKPLARLLHRIHGMGDERMCIKGNDFYPPAAPPLPAQEASEPAIVYVGMGIQGRRLEMLDVPALPFEVHVYFLGASLPDHLKGSAWRFGPVAYEEDLRRLRTEKRCFMWCALDNSFVSYRLALPNKFFQALALGIPIITSEKSYLARIVRKYSIGCVINDSISVECIHEQIRRLPYPDVQANVLALQERIRNHDIQL